MTAPIISWERMYALNENSLAGESALRKRILSDNFWGIATLFVFLFRGTHSDVSRRTSTVRFVCGSSLMFLPSALVSIFDTQI